jgi:hypothetical protein
MARDCSVENVCSVNSSRSWFISFLVLILILLFLLHLHRLLVIIKKCRGVAPNMSGREGGGRRGSGCKCGSKEKEED